MIKAWPWLDVPWSLAQLSMLTVTGSSFWARWPGVQGVPCGELAAMGPFYSSLIVMASNLLAMASTRVAMASNLNNLLYLYHELLWHIAKLQDHIDLEDISAILMAAIYHSAQPRECIDLVLFWANTSRHLHKCFKALCLSSQRCLEGPCRERWRYWKASWR